MILYLDTSAWVKLYVNEPGSQELQAYTAKAETLAASVVAYAEARATFARIKAQGISSEMHHQQRLAQLNLDWENMLRIELIPAVVRSQVGWARFCAHADSSFESNQPCHVIAAPQLQVQAISSR